VFRRTVTACALVALVVGALARPAAEEQPPANTWVRLHSDTRGGRRGCAVPYAPAAGAFFRWSFIDADREFRQEEPAISLSDYDMVAFDLDAKRSRGLLPERWAAKWSKKPPAFVPRTYLGYTGTWVYVRRQGLAPFGGLGRTPLAEAAQTDGTDTFCTCRLAASCG
jgi:hypothetical protein